MYKIVFMLVVIFNSLSLSQNYGSWFEIDSMSIARVGHAMVVLPNGNVLVSGSEADSIQSSCEIYEFSTGKWRYTAPMNVPRALHNLVMLNTGKVLAIGGYKEQSCELFDPMTETWTMTDSIPTFRFTGQTVTELADDRIMAAGGYYVDTTSWNFMIINKVDIYDPIMETWLEAAPMDLARYDHTATLLNDGKVLVTGGNTETFQTNECEIYNPLNNTWNITSPMLEPRYLHAAILLTNGNVFISGGDPSSGYTCEVYLVNSNQWNVATNTLIPRAGHKIYYSAKIDQLIIIGGGFLEYGPDTWEMYDPKNLQPIYFEAFPINQELKNNSVQLPNENIIVSGGWEYIYTPLPVFSPSKRSWILDITTDMSSINLGKNIFLLNQNYPNPFNPSTTIKYNLRSLSEVELKVYDLLGNEIALLVKEKQIAGNHQVIFNAKNLSSGIYYYRLTVKETEKISGSTFQQVKKMVLLR